MPPENRGVAPPTLESVVGAYACHDCEDDEAGAPPPLAEWCGLTRGNLDAAAFVLRRRGRKWYLQDGPTDVHASWSLDRAGPRWGWDEGGFGHYLNRVLERLGAAGRMFGTIEGDQTAKVFYATPEELALLAAASVRCYELGRSLEPDDLDGDVDDCDEGAAP